MALLWHCCGLAIIRHSAYPFLLAFKRAPGFLLCSGSGSALPLTGAWAPGACTISHVRDHRSRLLASFHLPAGFERGRRGT
jgi:hypothetical protein